MKKIALLLIALCVVVPAAAAYLTTISNDITVGNNSRPGVEVKRTGASAPAPTATPVDTKFLYRDSFDETGVYLTTHTNIEYDPEGSGWTVPAHPVGDYRVASNSLQGYSSYSNYARLTDHPLPLPIEYPRYYQADLTLQSFVAFSGAGIRFRQSSVDDGLLAWISLSNPSKYILTLEDFAGNTLATSAEMTFLSGTGTYRASMLIKDTGYNVTVDVNNIERINYDTSYNATGNTVGPYTVMANSVTLMERVEIWQGSEPWPGNDPLYAEPDGNTSNWSRGVGVGTLTTVGGAMRFEDINGFYGAPIQSSWTYQSTPDDHMRLWRPNSTKWSFKNIERIDWLSMSPNQGVGLKYTPSTSTWVLTIAAGTSAVFTIVDAYTLGHELVVTKSDNCDGWVYYTFLKNDVELVNTRVASSYYTPTKGYFGISYLTITGAAVSQNHCYIDLDDVEIIYDPTVNP